ncbi:MAG: hypothetical protein GY856_06815 [bacterium]|nr:hypothetical protein [bacterium]
MIKQTAFFDVRELADILDLLDIGVRIDAEHQAVVLRGPGDELDTALKLIEALDEPPAPSLSIELSVFILGASKEESATAELPADLEAVVGKLRKLFGYRGFELLDTLFLRVRDGSQGRLRGYLAEGITYDFSLNRAKVLGFNRATLEEEQSTLRFDGLTFLFQGDRSRLATDVEVREGQKAVVGKAAPGNGGPALILVIEAKIIE